MERYTQRTSRNVYPFGVGGLRPIKYSLLALDLDGTLTDNHKKVSAANKEYIARAQDAGVEIILASGRPVIGIRAVAEELHLFQKGGYILAYNGGQILDCKSGIDLVKDTIPMELNHAICCLNKRYQVHPLTYNETGVICENVESEYVRKEGYNNSIPVIQVKNLEAEITSPVVKFMVVGEPGELRKAYEYLKGLYQEALSIFFSEPYFMEVAPLGIEKACSLERLLKILSVDRTRLMACGDGLNDISMLKFAGLSVAMENAYDETKKYADYITYSNEKDGVAEAIRRFILEE